jgi:hypothetical protein
MNAGLPRARQKGNIIGVNTNRIDPLKLQVVNQNPEGDSTPLPASMGLSTGAFTKT